MRAYGATSISNTRKSSEIHIECERECVSCVENMYQYDKFMLMKSDQVSDLVIVLKIWTRFQFFSRYCPHTYIAAYKALIWILFFFVVVMTTRFECVIYYICSLEWKRTTVNGCECKWVIGKFGRICVNVNVFFPVVLVRLVFIFQQTFLCYWSHTHARTHIHTHSSPIHYDFFLLFYILFRSLYVSHWSFFNFVFFTSFRLFVAVVSFLFFFRWKTLNFYAKYNKNWFMNDQHCYCYHFALLHWVVFFSFVFFSKFSV